MMLDASLKGYLPFRGSSPGTQRHQALRVLCSATKSTEKAKPAWTGDDALSQLVNAAIGFKPLYSVMKILAKNMMRQTAEKNGVPWRQRVRELSATEEVFRLKEEVEDESIQYPSYYLQPFHAYEAGNLDWTAAFEVESATAAMAIRTWKDPSLTAKQALDKLYSNIFRCIEDFRCEQGALPPKDILDVGCSVGVSSREMAARYPAANVTGLDLSPHFLAVAELHERRRDASSGRRRIRYVHGLGERSAFQAESYDFVYLGFVIHECPPTAIQALIEEAHRLLRPDGVLTIVDNNPRSKTIQNLPPAIFTLMKSTEPWSDEYYQMDVEAALRETGFVEVTTKESDHRHRAVLALKPSS